MIFPACWQSPKAEWLKVILYLVISVKSKLSAGGESTVEDEHVRFK